MTKVMGPMIRRFLFALLAVLVASPAFAEDFKAGDITVAQPWARATPGASTNGVVYAEIRNGGPAPDRLLKLETEVAGSAAVHSMDMQDGNMVMRETGPLDLPAGGSVVLKPGGLHIMLMNLVKPLKTGDKFEMTLTFEHAGAVTATVVVAKPGASAAPAN